MRMTIVKWTNIVILGFLVAYNYSIKVGATEAFVHVHRTIKL